LTRASYAAFASGFAFFERFLSAMRFALFFGIVLQAFTKAAQARFTLKIRPK
jgi:hypothetical protein